MSSIPPSPDMSSFSQKVIGATVGAGLELVDSTLQTGSFYAESGLCQ
jgi:hypothetical protein